MSRNIRKGEDPDMFTLEKIKEQCSNLSGAGLGEVQSATFFIWYDIARPFFAKAGLPLHDLDVLSLGDVFLEWLDGKHEEKFRNDP
jgi:hypothetical protein